MSHFLKKDNNHVVNGPKLKNSKLEIMWKEYSQCG